MKLILVITCILAVLGAESQCTADYRHTVGIVATNTRMLGIEGGYSASEKPLSFHIGILISIQEPGTYIKEESVIEEPRDGQLQVAVAYRLLRKDYLVSLQLRAGGIMHINNGIDAFAGPQLLLPIKRFALSIAAPYYISQSRLELQAGVYFLIP